jgi:hypothetical protein
VETKSSSFFRARGVQRIFGVTILLAGSHPVEQSTDCMIGIEDPHRCPSTFQDNSIQYCEKSLSLVLREGTLSIGRAHFLTVVNVQLFQAKIISQHQDKAGCVQSFLYTIW